MCVVYVHTVPGVQVPLSVAGSYSPLLPQSTVFQPTCPKGHVPLQVASMSLPAHELGHTMPGDMLSAGTFGQPGRRRVEGKKRGRGPRGGWGGDATCTVWNNGDENGLLLLVIANSLDALHVAATHQATAYPFCMHQLVLPISHCFGTVL